MRAAWLRAHAREGPDGGALNTVTLLPAAGGGAVTRIAICAKHVVDVARVKIDKETNEPILKGVGKKVSVADKNAMEEALRLKDAVGGAQLVVYTVGTPDAKDSLKELLAMGADKAVILTPSVPLSQLDSLATATILADAMRADGVPQIIVCGDASEDDTSSQVGPRLAEALGISNVSIALKTTGHTDRVEVSRDSGNGTITIDARFPTLITVTEETNKPRLPNIMQIMAATKKPVELRGPETLPSLQHPPVGLVPVRVVALPSDRKGIILKDLPAAEMAQRVVADLKKAGLIGGD